MHMHWANIDGEKFTYFPCEIAFTSASLIGNSSIKRLHGHGIAYSITRHLTPNTKWCVNNRNAIQTQKHWDNKKKTPNLTLSPFLHWKTERETSAFVFISLQISIECLNSLFSFDTSNKRFNLLRKFFRIFARVLRAHILFMNEMRSQSRSTESS